MKHIFVILTDSCNFKCSFCYKRDSVSESVGKRLNPTMGMNIINWVIDKGFWDPSDPRSVINLWGGEPFLDYEMIKFFLNEYPQIHFRINTNGSLITNEVAKFLARHRYHLTLTLSLGSAHETYGGMKEAIEKLRPIVDQIARIDGSWGVNYTASHPEKLYEDYKIIKGYGIRHILIDIPRFVEISDAYCDLFMENYALVAQEYPLHDKRGLEVGQTYCGSGIDRIVIDPLGDVYPCDGLYGLRKHRLGNILQEHFNMGNIEFFQNLKNDVSRFYEKCKDCETQCSFERCMAVNISKNKDMFTPDPNWCKIRKVFKMLREKEVVHA